jgi:hypothetical protein
MSLSKTDILYKLAQETAYSSKGHFKRADWLRLSLGVYVFIPMVTSLLTLFFDLPYLGERIAGFLGLLFSMIALVSVRSNNRDRADEEIKKHMELGNSYLDIYKELRVLITQEENVPSEKIRSLHEAISKLDRESTSYQIGFVGRWWSKLRINSEMELDWLKDK